MLTLDTDMKNQTESIEIFEMIIFRDSDSTNVVCQLQCVCQ